jgi:hypothetical protein
VAAQKRKRAKGGGRKTIGPSAKSENFSTRITPELRAALDAEAALNDQSVSRMAERLLDEAITARRERARSNPTQALLYFIGALADQCAVNLLGEKRLDWNDYGELFDAFRLAVSLLFEALRPMATGSIDSELQSKVHTSWREFLRNPDDLGKWAFFEIWDDALAIKPPDEQTKRALLQSGAIDHSGIKTWERLGYDLLRARRDLKIGEKKP